MTQETVKTWLRKYWPWLLAGAAVLVLFFYLRRPQQPAQSIGSGYTPTTGGAAASPESIRAASQLETAQLQSQEHLAEATLAADTTRLQAQLSAETARIQAANALAATQAQYQYNLETRQAAEGGASQRSLFDLIGRSIPSILGFFGGSRGAGGPGAFVGDFTGGLAGAKAGDIVPTGPSSIWINPPIPQESTQASTIILPSPTFDSSGPPLKGFSPFGGVDVGLGSSFSNFASYGFA